MGCSSRTVSATNAVWNLGTSGVFVPFFEFRVNKVHSAKPSLILAGPTSTVQIQAAVVAVLRGQTWYSASGTAWGQTTFGPAATTSLGWTWGTAYDTPSDDYQFVRYGIYCSSTGSSAGHARATLVLDVKE
jgi:hypothetical protein